jgi:ATP-dependent DNA helicase RecG
MTPRENQSVEWKESWRDEYLKWIAAFANSDGGVLEIGRNDKGEVIGVPNIKELLEIIPNKVRDILGIIVKINIKKTK